MNPKLMNSEIWLRNEYMDEQKIEKNNTAPQTHLGREIERYCQCQLFLKISDLKVEVIV